MPANPANLDQQITDLRQLLNDWRLHSYEVGMVRNLETQTGRLGGGEIIDGAPNQLAPVQGYQMALKAYATLNGTMTPEQRAKVEKSSRYKRAFRMTI